MLVFFLFFEREGQAAVGECKRGCVLSGARAGQSGTVSLKMEHLSRNLENEEVQRER